MSGVPAASEVMVDNERVRATIWRLPPNGGETGWHQHELDYVITPVTGGALTIEIPAAILRSPRSLRARPISAAPGVKHNVMNKTGAEIVFVEVEMK